MVKKQLKALFIPLDGIGHVNACIGIAESLIGAGHRVSFLMNTQWEGKLKHYGIDEILYPSLSGRKPGGNPALEWARELQKSGIIGPNGSLDKMVAWVTKFIPVFIRDSQAMDKLIDKTIAELRPDVIFLDQIITMASVERSGIPWVWVCSYNPLFHLEDIRTPPAGSGFATNGDRKEWAHFRQTVNEATKDIWREFNDYIVGNGLPPLDYCQYIRAPTHLHIYPLPVELDYTDLRPVPDRCLQLDNLMRKDVHASFTLPDQLANKPGKLIYVGLGSMVLSDLDNTKRLMAILAKSKHRFIVSKGPHHDKYELPGANMWGAQTVSQIQVLPLVDLVVTHGGNNTVTETLYYGKPMVVLPVFADQFDNAQRLHELGYGIRLDAYKCSDAELLCAINKLLNDNELNAKLSKIATRIQSDDKISQVPGLIEKLCNGDTNRHK
ncbi:unnamed protein product [Medioppia subpectinata]|uniref:UDP-glycosyltransferase n=1 Tax=Medioppia subpectinata TaxID=1979941 RepID=A0A7R9KYE3_9ACAR|nr:unnamed protein product [Medioppia subpectinata]CAG2111007.1 unnamed protein product [Medioppia subpectinata]